MLALALIGCTPEPALLEPSFGERLQDGYHCTLGWYLAHDPDQTLRLQADLVEGSWMTGPPATTGFDDEVHTELGSDEFAVYVGTCLSIAGCTDDPDPPPGACTDPQEIAHVYDAVAGTAELWWNDDGTIAGRVTGLVLEGRDGEPAVEVDELVLPAVPEWTE